MLLFWKCLDFVIARHKILHERGENIMTVLSQKEIFTINHKGGSLPELIVNQEGVVNALKDLKNLLSLEHIRISDLDPDKLAKVQDFRNKYVPNRDELLGNFKDTIVYAELRMIERLFENAQYKEVEKCLIALQEM